MKRPAMALAIFLVIAAMGAAPDAQADDGQPLESVLSWLESLDLSWIWSADQPAETSVEPAEPAPDSASQADDPEYGPSIGPNG